MRLPNVDIYRQPFIEPLGYLTLMAAQVDHLVVEIIAAIRASPERLETDLEPEQIAASDAVRHWTEAKMESVISDALNLQLDEHRLASLRELLTTFESLRRRRHRAIHDAVKIGYDEQVGAINLAVGYEKTGKITHLKIDEVTPEQIAEIACEFDELRADLSAMEYFLRRDRGGDRLD